MTQKLLIYLKHRYQFWCISPQQVMQIRKKFPSLKVNVAYDEAEVTKEIEDADFYFGWHMPIPVLAAAQKLQWVHTPSAGRDYIDSPQLRERQIEFTTSEGYHGIFMAQHALGMMVYFAKAMHLSKKGFWLRDDTAQHFFDLNAAKVLIVGCGSIGLKLAELCTCFGMQVTGYRRTIPNEADQKMAWVGPKDLHGALTEAKIVVNLLPGTPETYHFFNQEMFSHFRQGAVFINLGRGRTVDENALLNALDQKIVMGCGLDVLEVEPPVEKHPLFLRENVLITPHSSAFSYQYLDHAVEYFCQKLAKRLQKGGTG